MEESESHFRRSLACLGFAGAIAALMMALEGDWLIVAAGVGAIFAVAGFILFWRDLLDYQLRRFRDYAATFWSTLKDAYDDYSGQPQPRDRLTMFATPPADREHLNRFVRDAVYPRQGALKIREPHTFHMVHSRMCDLVKKWAERPFLNPYFRTRMYDELKRWHEPTLTMLEIVIVARADREGVPAEFPFIERLRDIWRDEQARRLVRKTVAAS